jgi:hypothetical protein
MKHIDNRNNHEWKVGYNYWVYDNGQKVWGTILAILEDIGCIVKWQDGTETVEGTPKPASDYWEREWCQSLTKI